MSALGLPGIAQIGMTRLVIKELVEPVLPGCLCSVLLLQGHSICSTGPAGFCRAPHWLHALGVHASVCLSSLHRPPTCQTWFNAPVLTALQKGSSCPQFGMP